MQTSQQQDVQQELKRRATTVLASKGDSDEFAVNDVLNKHDSFYKKANQRHSEQIIDKKSLISTYQDKNWLNPQILSTQIQFNQSKLLSPNKEKYSRFSQQNIPLQQSNAHWISAHKNRYSSLIKPNQQQNSLLIQNTYEDNIQQQTNASKINKRVSFNVNDQLQSEVLQRKTQSVQIQQNNQKNIEQRQMLSVIYQNLQDQPKIQQLSQQNEIVPINIKDHISQNIKKQIQIDKKQSIQVQNQNNDQMQVKSQHRSISAVQDPKRTSVHNQTLHTNETQQKEFQIRESTQQHIYNVPIKEIQESKSTFTLLQEQKKGILSKEQKRMSGVIKQDQQPKSQEEEQKNNIVNQGEKSVQPQFIPPSPPQERTYTSILRKRQQTSPTTKEVPSHPYIRLLSALTQVQYIKQPFQIISSPPKTQALQYLSEKYGDEFAAQLHQVFMYFSHNEPLINPTQLKQMLKDVGQVQWLNKLDFVGFIDSISEILKGKGILVSDKIRRYSTGGIQQRFKEEVQEKLIDPFIKNANQIHISDQNHIFQLLLKNDLVLKKIFQQYSEADVKYGQYISQHSFTRFCNDFQISPLITNQFIIQQIFQGCKIDINVTDYNGFIKNIVLICYFNQKKDIEFENSLDQLFSLLVLKQQQQQLLDVNKVKSPFRLI